MKTVYLLDILGGHGIGINNQLIMVVGLFLEMDNSAYGNDIMP